MLWYHYYEEGGPPVGQIYASLCICISTRPDRYTTAFYLALSLKRSQLILLDDGTIVGVWLKQLTEPAALKPTNLHVCSCTTAAGLSIQQLVTWSEEWLGSPGGLHLQSDTADAVIQHTVSYRMIALTIDSKLSSTLHIQDLYLAS